MSFRIDLATKNGVNIFLVVVRNQININFAENYGVDRGVSLQLQGYFGHLLSHFSLDHTCNFVRGEDPEHIKRHHGYEGEVRIIHHHVAFDQDVTPPILASFLMGIFLAQVEHHDEDHFQFINLEKVQSVIGAFNIFYAEFVGSSLQTDFLVERQLTEPEAQSLVRDRSVNGGDFTESDRSEIGNFGIAVPETLEDPVGDMLSFLGHMLFGSPQRREPGSTTEAPTEDSISMFRR